MLAKAIFTGTFLLLTVGTLILPSLPPAKLLFDQLKIPQTTQTIGGISITVNLQYSIMNGLFWALTATALYVLADYAIKRRPLPPMPKAPNLSTPPPEPMLVDWRISRIPPALTVRQGPTENQQDIEKIPGIGRVYGRVLRKSGIRTIDDLLRAGASKRGRLQLCSEVGVTQATLLKWVYRGDLLRISGIGKRYSTLLESAGVNTVTDLSARNPRYLCQLLKAVNNERNLVMRTPPAATIEIWVRNAKKLEPIVV